MSAAAVTVPFYYFPAVAPYVFVATVLATATIVIVFVVVVPVVVAATATVAVVDATSTTVVVGAVFRRWWSPLRRRPVRREATAVIPWYVTERETGAESARIVSDGKSEGGPSSRSSCGRGGKVVGAGGEKGVSTHLSTVSY